jgi:hypothetical protein
MESTETRTVEAFSLWGTAYAMTRGVRLVQVIPGRVGRAAFLLDDSDGRATEALNEWREGHAMVNGRNLVEVQRELIVRAKRMHDENATAKWSRPKR